MTQRGHVLDDAWYLDFAAGSLASEAEAVLVRSHVELNEDASERVAGLDRIGGALLERLPAGQALSFNADDLLALAEADDVVPADTPAFELPGELDGVDVPEALKAYLSETGVRVKWEFLGPGLRKAILWRGEGDTNLWLLRAEPGVAIPHHGHNGSELTLVLKGSFWDGDQEYRRGDVEEAHPDIEHDIRIDPSGVCVCLALTHGKLRFANPLLRAFQVFTGL
ncbi:ChrR family anti-sigma-E factor [Maricaulis maris]|uniref:ChrR-like anti-ECFsigma factor n=1 Tax=Maricaulis maris TaxID=74318 RepID=A0A495D5P1_9PROT|nr:ChrR family anti-sigma-E factor [Maricaulis maris]RKQ96478.1 ChrR-like anti-ECFsigma factor [Maricaulis maris]